MGKSNSREKEAKNECQEITVYIYESEYRRIQAWVDKYQELETGGDLFGLWADDHTAVVQLVLGPGEHCTRTSASFYQDVEYLDRVGNKLTNNEGLCHIGEWHSHHRLGLTRPSRGDKETVWTNMDRYGIKRFCLFIANIDRGWSHAGSIQYYVNVHGFLFQLSLQNNRRYPGPRQVKFEHIQEESPFRFKYEKDIQEGAERMNNEDQLEAGASYVPGKERGAERMNNEDQLEAGASYVPGKKTRKIDDAEYEGLEPEKPAERSSGICSCFSRFLRSMFNLWLS